MRTALIAAYGASLLVAVLGHAMLPPEVASHFGASGAADGWAPRAFHTGLFLVMNTVIFVLFLLGPRLAFKVPDDLINLPNREYWLAAGRREAALEILSRLVHEFGAATLALTVVVMVLTIQANGRQPPHLDSDASWIALGAYLAYTAVWCVRLLLAFRRPRPGEPGAPLTPR